MKSRLQIGVWLVSLSGLLTTVWAADAPLKSYKDIPSPEGNARRITEVMRTELGLSEKQYKKVYKIQLEEQKKIFKYRPMPQRGEREGLEQRPPRGRHPEGGRPPMAGRFDGRGGGRPPMPPHEMSLKESRPDPEKVAKELDKAAQKRDKKLKKALDDSQYARWKAMEEEVLRPYLFKPEPGKPGPGGPKPKENDIFSL